MTRRIAPDDDGWGPAVGESRFTLHPHDLELAVPLSAIGADDGRLDYALELYATVPCSACAGGGSQVFVSDSFGSTTSSRRSDVVALIRVQGGGTAQGGGVVPSARLMRAASVR